MLSKSDALKEKTRCLCTELYNAARTYYLQTRKKQIILYSKAS